MDFNELLALRLSLNKLQKSYVGTMGPDEDVDIFSQNLLASAALAHYASLHYVDKLLARILELNEERNGNAATQGGLFRDVSKTQPANQAEMRAVAESFLKLHDLDVDIRASQPPAPVDGFVPTADLVRQAWVGAQPDRTVPPVEVIATWSVSDLNIAYDWAMKVIGGSNVPPPIVVATRYLEDLVFCELDDRILLASWVGFTVVDDVNWSLDLWREVWDWTRAYHLCERIEDPTDDLYPESVPDMPRIFVPEQHLYRQIKAFVFESLGTATISAVVEQLGGHAVEFAVLAMLAAGEILGRKGALLSADKSELERTTDVFGRTVDTLGKRQTSVTLAEDGTLYVQGGESEDGEEAEYMEDKPADGEEGEKAS